LKNNFKENGPQELALQSPVLAGAVAGYRSAKNKSNNQYGKISSFGHKFFFPVEGWQ
jgi:hypothetical protein